MPVHVHLPAEVRRRVGQRRVTVEAPEPATFEAVVRRLGADDDPCFLELLDLASGGAGRAPSRPWMRHVLVNERWLDLPRDLAVDLRDGDHVYFIQPVAGGA